MEHDVNPYEPPACVEPAQPTVKERMDSLRREFEGRYGQLVSDGVMAVQFSVAFGLAALKVSDDVRVAGGVAVATTLLIGAEALRDLVAKTCAFPAKMDLLREEATAEWWSSQRRTG